MLQYGRNMKKILILPLILILPICLFSTTWYVRPPGGDYGTEDGTTYADAWDGLENVVWGGAGVVAGDTLYVCGTHLSTYSGGNPPKLDVGSGSNGSRITIRGDYGGDAGIIWGAAYSQFDTWADEGSGTWSTDTNSTNNTTMGVFEDPSDATATLLDPAVSVQDCKDTAGSFYTDGTTTIYVHRNNGADPTSTVAIARLGYMVELTSQAYVTLQSITFICLRNGFSFTNGEHHITWESCTWKWFEGECITWRQTSPHDMIVNGCTASYCRDGFLAAVTVDIAGVGLYDSEITNNTIHHMGYPTAWYPAGDQHGCGAQDCDNILIEGNEIYNCEHGIVLYANTVNQVVTNVTVRYNYLHDMNANTHGISFRGDNTNEGSHTGNSCYENIIDTCSIGVFVKYSDNVDVYNNVMYNCAYSLSANGMAGQTTSPAVIFKNNISLSPTSYHIYFESPHSEGSYNCISDYNCFYPTTGDDFYFDDGDIAGGAMTYEEWQALSKAGCTFDPNSVDADPAFVNAGGSYDLDTDFQIPTGSPCKDAGINVGLGTCYFGVTIPSGAAQDIGAHEYDQGDTPHKTILKPGVKVIIGPGGKVIIKEPMAEFIAMLSRLTTIGGLT